MEYKVSILIPVYNTENYLRKCLDSVINQTLKDIEIIIVNDGSKDNSQDIIEEYALRDKRIKYFIQENSGLGATRNKGIELSKGQYIAFLDSDDWVERDCYEKLYNKAIENDLDLVIADYYIDFPNYSNEYKTNYKSSEKQKYLNDVILRNVSGFSWNKLYKKSIIDQNKMKFPIRGELENVEDQYFTIRYIYACNKIDFVNLCLIHYIIRNSSIVNSYQKNILDDGLALYKANFDFFYTNNASKEIYSLLDISVLKHIIQVIYNEAKYSNCIKITDKIANIKKILSNEICREKLNYFNLNKNNIELSKDEKLYLKLLNSNNIYILYLIVKIRTKILELRIKKYN